MNTKLMNGLTVARGATVALALALLAAALPALSQEGQKKERKTYDREPEMKIDQNKVYVARVETTAGPIVLELYPKQAPHHVNSFVFLAKEGFYDGVIFHRVIPGFMVQGGDPTGTGGGGPGYKLKAEFNETKHVRGVLSAARTPDPNSAGSQFFLMHGEAPHLDRQYTAYGKVVEGMETVDKIAQAPTGEGDRPTNPVSIKSIKIEEKAASK
ncbi:MAG TPA: peptidylprolyl isomerase [Tepidisphaeraceae bacterium]|nr:peptidylprolyl isomerase [Tepidisphaeraceae bacterium]